MIHAQPVVEFGEKLNEELRKMEDGQLKWKELDFAVAWVNQRGVQKIGDAIEHFASKGGKINAVVGLDFNHTSKEGLIRLLEIEEKFKGVTTNVFYDENPACTFHPKVFLFKNTTQAQLYVGSNNMTGAGLSTNIEMSLGFTGNVNDKTIEEVSSILLSWRDESIESRTRRLSYDFLEELCERGYVKTEAAIQKIRQFNKPSPTKEQKPLFGRSKNSTKKEQTSLSLKKATNKKIVNTNRESLLMKVKPRRNGRQIQISMKIYEGPFMNGTPSVISSTTGESREIGFNYTTNKSGKRKRNTARFEAPEIEGMDNPVVRFRWVEGPKNHLQYEAYDANANNNGKDILNKLSVGITIPPITKLERIHEGITVLSKGDRESAQWYRLD
ncbi:phospholipase D-like domain-containing protein [Vibrio antiquarius]|uniref:phospholipase D-like domain-containing protein n=1 Tax=Vibrio diabolicus subgroup TaxID=2315253 RepID=UPI002658D81B|nr:phospholipase D-like domain-containing protein [Vibrio antiquarius]MCR9938233.1 phospholipase D-like domain-containing protein [Vibrio antiquarius]HCG6086269.1 hypothetical protein [Vibrio parahaemolyticus]